MSYVNGTTHYNLPQTVGTDKRDWADTNQAFADVDAALYTASETASTAASNISTLDNQINGEGGIDARLTTAENDIDNVEGSVSTLQNTVSGHTTAIADVRTDCEDMIVAVEITAAQMEDSPVAIPTGSYFRYNDVLYVATADIAIHDVIVPNTNCEATNVATEFGKVNTALSEEHGTIELNSGVIGTLSYSKNAHSVTLTFSNTSTDMSQGDTTLATETSIKPNIKVFSQGYAGSSATDTCVLSIDTDGVIKLYNPQQQAYQNVTISYTI